MRLAALAIAAAATAVVGTAAERAHAAPARKDWSRVILPTPAGTYVIGNPKAKVKIVEYLSLTCSHCAHFAGEAFAPLKTGYIAKGLVSLELRHALRDRYDLTATLIARCAGPAGMLGTIEAMFREQTDWLAKAQAFEQSDGGKTAALPMEQGIATVAHAIGVDAIGVARGVPLAKQKACIAKTAEQQQLAGMAKEAWEERKIPGTPAFLINGRLVEGVNGWAALEPKIKDALR